MRLTSVIVPGFLLCLLACSRGSENQEEQDKWADVLTLEHLEFANRIEIRDGQTSVIQKDVDGNWYYAGMELLDSVSINDLLQEVRQLEVSMANKHGSDQNNAIEVVFDGPHIALPDTFRQVSNPEGKSVLCATNAQSMRCTDSETHRDLIFRRLPAIIDQR